MRKKLVPALAAAYCLLLLCYPGAALESAREACRLWAAAFAPALFPFFAVLPALNCKEALSLYERALGRVLPRLFGIPGAAAGAVAVGLMAGSPAGAAALSRAAGYLTRAEALRAALLSFSLSPAFLIAALGRGMLGSGEAGLRIWLSGLGSSLLVALLFRRVSFPGSDAPLLGGAEPSGAAREETLSAAIARAVGAVLNVCGWMILFSSLSGALSAALRLPRWALGALIEVTGGAAGVAALPLEPGARLSILAFFCALTGLSVLAQNLGRLPALPRLPFLLGKLLTALLSALLIRLPAPLPAASPEIFCAFPAPLYLACALAILLFAISFYAARRKSAIMRKE